MKKRKHTDEPMGELKVVKDFLPMPEQLVVKEEDVRVTISLNKSSVEFFRKTAQEYHTSYQRMIGRFLDWYASQHQAIAENEILGEVWRNRDAYVEKHHHNLDEIVRDLQKRQKTSPLKLVDRRKRRTKRSD